LRLFVISLRSGLRTASKLPSSIEKGTENKVTGHFNKETSKKPKDSDRKNFGVCSTTAKRNREMGNLRSPLVTEKELCERGRLKKC
jgi:hypothetical protein